MIAFVGGRRGQGWQIYTTLGMGLLGHVLSLQSGMSYEELVAARITDELGVSDTRVTLTSTMQSRLATGYRVRCRRDRL
jgi:CubicO group peptidase (beta-lactamase class C family)